MTFASMHLPDELPLRDIHMPPAPPWWPPAPGWWVLAAVLCALLVIAVLIYRRIKRIRIWRARVLAEIQTISLHHAHDDIAYASSLHQLLRRVARLYANDAHQVQGERWRGILAQVPVDDANLDTLMTLDARMYRPGAVFDRHAMEAAAHSWMQAVLRSSKLMGRAHA